MKLSEIRSILADRQIQLSKSLGQNFLHDRHQLCRIIQAAEIQAGDRVLEVGPGLGPLTELLLASGARVLAIEKDQRLFASLSDRVGGHASCKLLHDDALSYLRSSPIDWREWKSVSNLPYSAASRILLEMSQAAMRPTLIVGTLQLEVAQRLVAKEGTGDYGVLALLVQLRYRSEGWFEIPARCFFPVPEVASACVRLRRRDEPLLPPALESRFDAIVKRGFSQRRKMMMKLLKSDWPPERLERAWREIPLSRQVRAEEVRLDQFVKLTRILAESDSMSPAFEIFDVVNEWDEVIGCETRANVHRLGLRHRAVHVLVFNRRGQLFLQKRSMEKDCFPGAWDSSAAGHLDRGETYDACAVRELREELGVEAVTAPVRLFKIDACPETGHEFTWVYRCEIEGPFKLQPDEIEEGGWFDSSEISAWIADRPGDFASALLVIWEKIRNGPHSVF